MHTQEPQSGEESEVKAGGRTPTLGLSRSLGCQHNKRRAGTGSYLTLINLDPGSTTGAGLEESSTAGSWHSRSGAGELPGWSGLSEHREPGFLNSNTKPGLALARLSLSLCLKTLFV